MQKLPVKIHLESDPRNSKIEIDEQDLTKHVRAITIIQDALSLPKIEITLIGLAGIDIVGEANVIFRSGLTRAEYDFVEDFVSDEEPKHPGIQRIAVVNTDEVEAAMICEHCKQPINVLNLHCEYHKGTNDQDI